MYTNLDKTILLKGVDFFSAVDGESLFHIAQLSIEEEYLENEIIFEKDSIGDCMFIIINGSVLVFNNTKEIATLNKGDCFGEMALLDQEPRSSSVRAISDTTVLKIEAESFYELVAKNIEIMQGIVKILSKRLRKAIT